MARPLTEHFDDLRRRLRRAGVLRGLSLVVLAGVAGTSIAVVLDALLRSGSPIVRLLLAVVAVVPAGWFAVRALIPALRTRPSDVELARRVEKHDPHWAGRLSASAAFMHQDPAVGSQTLQRRVIDEATTEVAANPLPELVDRKRLRRMMFAAAGVLGVGVLLAIVNFHSTATAITRIALPWSAIEWPRQVDLVLTTDAGEPIAEEIQIGRGQTFRFTIRNRRGDVPDDLTLEVVSPDGQRSEAVPVSEETAGDAGTTRTVGVGSLFAASGPIKFRARGGDHQEMRFITAQVVPPPVFDRMQLTITPPAYLGDEPVTLPVGVGSVTGIVGSSVTVEAEANKPLVSAELRVGDRSGPATEIDDEGRRLTATFTLTKPGLSSYWFRLRDESGFENPESPRYEIRAIADALPELSIVEPAGDLRATTAADLPLLVEAADDHGLTGVRLRFGQGLSVPESGTDDDESQSATIPLFSGPDRPNQGSYPLIWSLESLGLLPGDRLTFRAEANDAFDLGPPHVGRSSPRTITIVTAVEKREELLDRQAELLDELSQVRDAESRVREGVASLLAQLDRAKELRPEDLDLLARAEFEQRRLAGRLTDPADGLGQLAAKAGLEVRANRIDDPALAARMDRIATELSILHEETLPDVDHNLTTARKAESPEAAATALSAVKGGLNVMLHGLDALLDDLGAWRNRRNLAAEANELLANQRELADETSRAAAETLGTAAGQLSGQQSATLERLGLRQTGLADRLSRLASAIDQLADPHTAEQQSEYDSEAGSDSEAVDAAADASTAPTEESDSRPPAVPDPRFADAAELLRSAAMPATARAAGESIRSNSLGEAGRLQRDLLTRLTELKETLGRTDTAGPRAETLQHAAERLDELTARQQELVETLQKAAESPEGLSDDERDLLQRDQMRLKESAAAVGRDLRKAASSEIARGVSRAAQHMSDGLERLRRREDDAAKESLERAVEQLRRSGQQAKERAERLGEQLSHELVESSVGLIAALAERQGAVNREVARLDEIKRNEGRFSRSQLLTLRRTAQTQVAVIAETEQLAEKLAPAEAVAFALRSAAASMQRQAEALDRKETGEEVQRNGRVAKSRLDQVSQALKPTPGDPQSEDGEEELFTPQEGPPGEGISLIAQLQLIKAMQEDLYERTKELDAARMSGESTAAALQRLSDEQQALSELFLQLVGAATPPDEVVE